MARISCLIILILELRGLFLALPGRGWKMFVFYTQLSNLAATISAALLIIFGQPAWVTALRYLSVCMLLMTVFVTTCVLIPLGGDAKALLLSGNGLYHHMLCPLACVLSYGFLEQHAGKTMMLFPILVTTIYGLLMFYLNAKGIVDGPYPFFRVKHQSKRATVFWFIALLGVIAGCSVVVAFVAR